MNKAIKHRSMRTLFTAVIAVGVLLVGHVPPAAAHVTYFDAGTFDGTALAFSHTDSYRAFGWVFGTNVDLGNSHFVNYYRFTLNQPGLVDISLLQDTAGLDPAFTLYRGVHVPSVVTHKCLDGS